MTLAGVARNKLEGLQAEMLALAENQMAGFLSVKLDIYNQLAEIHGRLDKVKVKIRENVRSQENPEGVFTLQKEDYLKCLELQHEELESLMRYDETHWATNNVQIQRQVYDIQNYLQEYFHENQQKCDTLVTPSPLKNASLEPARNLGFHIRKLPLWGE